MIRKAFISDIKPVMKIIDATKIIMEQENNPQWDYLYPLENNFLNDIEAGTLYIYEMEKEIGGVICIDTREPEEYKNIKWSKQGPATVIHRLAVDPKKRGHKIGTKFFDFAEQMARDNGTLYLKSDTYGRNHAMNLVFLKKGFVFKGHMHYRNKPELFNCYEKILVNI